MESMLALLALCKVNVNKAKVTSAAKSNVTVE